MKKENVTEPNELKKIEKRPRNMKINRKKFMDDSVLAFVPVVMSKENVTEHN